MFLTKYFVFSAGKKPMKLHFQTLHYDECMHTIYPELTCDSYFVDKHLKSTTVRVFSAKISPSKYMSLAEFLMDEKLQPG